MRGLAIVGVLVAALSTLIGLISRLSVAPIFSLESRAYVGFAALCLLFAITFLLLEKK